MRKIERQGKVSAHAEVCRNFLQMNYAPFHRAWLIKFSGKTEFRQIRMSRGRERWREREEYGERGEGGREGERRGKGRIMYTICAPFATLFSEKGEVQRRQIQVKIHIKTKE